MSHYLTTFFLGVCINFQWLLKLTTTNGIT